MINAAAAHLDGLDALRRSPDQAGGRPYFIAQDEPVSCWDWISEICEIGGVGTTKKRISFRCRLHAWVRCWRRAYRVTRRKSEPPMTRFVAAQLARDHYFDISQAKERLGYRVRVTDGRGA